MFDFPFDAVKSVSSADHSRYVQRIRRRYPQELADFAQACQGVPRSADIAALIQRFLDGGRELGSALRVARQMVIERLATEDVQGGAPMADIGRAMTELAETTLAFAQAQAEAEATARHGQPLNAEGTVVDLWVVEIGRAHV